MSPTTPTSPPANNTAATSNKYQEQLKAYCRAQRFREPTIRLVSDLRGGRTAWSADVCVNGKYISAKFWYEGNRTAQAAEDAAQRALMDLGQLPRPQYEVPPHLQQVYPNNSVRT